MSFIRILRCVYGNCDRMPKKITEMEIPVKNLLTTGNSPEKRLWLTKKDNCVKGLRLLCRSVFLLKLSGYMFE